MASPTTVSRCMSAWSIGPGRTSTGSPRRWRRPAATEQRVRAALSMLYAACGVGPARDVAEGAGTLYVIRKRIGQHAAALRRLVPCLDRGDADALSATAAERWHSRRPRRSWPFEAAFPERSKSSHGRAVLALAGRVPPCFTHS